MASVKSLLTPKELAQAIGSSESSVRRWVDAGDIRMSRTAGGHRRIPLQEAIRFIRQMGAPVLHPEMLGLSELSQPHPWPAGLSDDDKLSAALLAGERDVARGLILSWYLEGRSLPALFDGPMRAALHRLGEFWTHDARGILIEHRATQICIEAIATLRGLLPATDAAAPLAMGGAAQTDPYQVPSMMVSAVLAEAGFSEVNFGANTPLDLLRKEAVDRGAKLVWISLSTHQESIALRKATAELALALAGHQIPLVIGGRYHADITPKGAPRVKIAESMSDLSEFALEVIRGRS